MALLDIGLPGMSGIEGIGPLRKLYPAMPVMMLTVYKDDERIFKALCAGARGYLLKKTPPARLLEGLREVVGGDAPIPEVARRCSNYSSNSIRPIMSIINLRLTNCDC